MNIEITTKHVQLARSGYYARGLTNACTLISIPNNKISKHAVVKYKGMRIGRIDNLYYSDLRDGRVELHGNITFTGSLTMLAEMVKDEALYPVCVINTQTGPNQSWLAEVFFATAEHREFDEQEPINLKGLLNLASLIAEPEAPESAVRFHKKYDNTNSGFIGYTRDKIYLNETDTLEAKDGYLIINTKETIEAVRIEMIGVITSTDNRKGSSNISIHTTSCSIEIRNSDIGAKGILKFIEDYKMRAYAALKVN